MDSAINTARDTLDRSLIERAAPTGSMRYFAWLYTSPAHRDELAALLLIDAELHDSARAPHDVAHVRLQWWRDEIERLINNHAQHPATRVLQAKRTAQVNYQYLQNVVLTAAQDLANSTFETEVELGNYLKNGAGSLFMLAAQHLSSTPLDQPLLDVAQQLGTFVRQVEINRDLRQDVAHGRLYLPLAQLDANGIEYEHVHTADWSAPFVSWFKQHCEQQLHHYRALTRTLLDTESSCLRPLLVLSELHSRVLTKIIRNPAQCTRQRIELGAFEKPWTAWRAARTAS